MRKKLVIVTIAICILMLISVMPVSAVNVKEKPRGDGTEIKLVKPPTDAEAAAALGTATVKTAAVSSVATIPVLKTPTLVSPANGIMLYSYPRTTLLVWKPVDGATGYLVDRAYYSGSTWYFYPTVTVTGNKNTVYQFDFVGDQEGCWRVTAIGDSTHANSNPSAFRTFAYTTGLTLTQPKQVSPADHIPFYNYPRTTELMWKPVPGANAYKIERQYCDGGYPNPCPDAGWKSYSDAQVDGVLNTDYTFDFIGMQEGRWRVTAIDTSGMLRSSPASTWRNFTYTV